MGVGLIGQRRACQRLGKPADPGARIAKAVEARGDGVTVVICIAAIRGDTEPVRGYVAGVVLTAAVDGGPYAELRRRFVSRHEVAKHAEMRLVIRQLGSGE